MEFKDIEYNTNSGIPSQMQMGRVLDTLEGTYPSP